MNYNELKLLKICVNCRTSRAVDNKTKCQKCLDWYKLYRLNKTPLKLSKTPRVKMEVGDLRYNWETIKLHPGRVLRRDIKCTNCGLVREKVGLITSGCRNCSLREKEDCGLRKLMGTYLINSRKNCREFSLTLEEFKKLTSGLCYYCGAKPSFVSKTHNKTTWGNYNYNGIDRKDNSTGYIYENCVTCCFICNRAKNNMVFNDFVNYIKNTCQSFSLNKIECIKNEK